MCLEKNIFLISGMSGAGKSVCLKHFEDAEYEIIRGLPVELLSTVIESMKGKHNVAIEVFSKQLIPCKTHVIELIKLHGIKVIFLDSSDNALILRYKESRRKHPLDNDYVIEGIRKEREGLCEIRELAEHVVDTTAITPYELKLIMNKEIFKKFHETKVVVISFSYKKGVPIEADCVFDVRFLKNPYYDQELRSVNGTQKEIHEYLKDNTNVTQYLLKTKEYLNFMLTMLNCEGRDVFYIAFGCTGGFHRSVFIAENIASHFTDLGIDTTLLHRDLKIIKS